MKNDNYILQTVERALLVLEALSLKAEGCGVTQLANEVNLNKSTVFRILYTLQQNGYVEQIPGSEKYQLSIKLIHLGSNILDRMDLREIAKPYLQLLLDDTKETVHLGILDKNEVVYIEKFESIEHSIRMYSQVGKRVPVHCSAMGKVLLSDFSNDKIKEILKNKILKKYTNSTICDIDKLISEISIIRTRGYAFDNEEHEIGVCCIAAPVYDISNHIVASISLSIPIIYFTEDRIPFLIKKLRKTAKIISRQLGYNKVYESVR